MNKPNSDSFLILILRLGAFLCLSGWTWVHFYWQGPYGILLWQDGNYALANKLGISWEAFVGSGAEDGLVQVWIARTGWFYLAFTVLTLTVRKNAWIQMAALLAGSVFLTILSYAKYLGAQRQLPMFVEHGGQILIPILLVMALALGVRHRVTVSTAILAFLMTFAGHGSYALGFWPTPANFYGMTSVILQVDYATAKAILHTAGILDFIVCLGLFIPFLRLPSTLYAAVWGFLTAIARPAAGMSFSLHYWGADQFLQEAVLRSPHFLIPLYLFFLWYQPGEARIPEKVPMPDLALSARMPTHLPQLFTDKPKTLP